MHGAIPLTISAHEFTVVGAIFARTTTETRIKTYSVPWFEIFHSAANGDDDAGAVGAEHVRRRRALASLFPAQANITIVQSHRLEFDDGIAGRFDCRQSARSIGQMVEATLLVHIIDGLQNDSLENLASRIAR